MTLHIQRLSRDERELEQLKIRNSFAVAEVGRIFSYKHGLLLLGAERRTDVSHETPIIGYFVGTL